MQRFADLLGAEGAIDRAGLEAIRVRAEREFDQAYEFGQRSSLPDPSELMA